MVPLRMTLLECARGAFGDAYSEMGAIYENWHGVVEDLGCFKKFSNFMHGHGPGPNGLI